MSTPHATLDSPITLLARHFLGDVPPTPMVAPDGVDRCPSATHALRTFADEIGFAVGYDREQHGALIQDIYPIRTREHEQVSTSSKVMLGSHTETAFHPHKPRYVVLLCLRGDRNAATTYADVHDIVSCLSTDSLNALQAPEFVTTIDPSFMTNGEPDADVTVTPLVVTPGECGEVPDGWTFTYDELLMKGTTPRAIRALSELHRAVKSCTKQVVLRQGDILVIDNHRAVHGRTPFIPRYDGTDRWLKRALVVETLPRDVVDRVIQTRL